MLLRSWQFCILGKETFQITYCCQKLDVYQKEPVEKDTKAVPRELHYNGDDQPVKERRT